MLRASLEGLEMTDYVSPKQHAGWLVGGLVAEAASSDPVAIEAR